MTNLEDPLEEIRRDYNQRVTGGGIEQRIEELKPDLAADDFCLKVFFPTEAAFLTSGLARELHQPITGVGRSHRLVAHQFFLYGRTIRGR